MELLGKVHINNKPGMQDFMSALSELRNRL